MYKHAGLLAGVFTACALLSTSAYAHAMESAGVQPVTAGSGQQQQPDGPQNPLPAFDELDKNNDGKLDQQEAQGTPYEQRIRESGEGTMSEQQIDEYNREMYLPDEEEKQDQQGN